MPYLCLLLLLQFSLIFKLNLLHLLTVLLIHLNVRRRIAHKQLFVDKYSIVESLKLSIEV